MREAVRARRTPRSVVAPGPSRFPTVSQGGWHAGRRRLRRQPAPSPWIRPLLHRNRAESALHVSIDHLEHSGHQPLEIEARDGGDAPRSVPGGLEVESDRPTEPQTDRDVTCQDVGVGHGQLGSTPAISSGPGVRPRRGRTYTKRSTVIYPGDTAPTGADGVNRDRRNPVDPARHTMPGTHRGHAIGDATDIGGGATHVEGDHRTVAVMTAQRSGGDNAARGPGQDETAGPVGCVPERDQTTSGRHDETGRDFQTPVERAQIAGNRGCQIGGEDRRRQTLVLPKLRRDVR